MIYEADVALTDYALCLVCAWLAVSTWRRPRRRVGAWATLLFSTVAAGAFFGGTAHGFVQDHASSAFRMLWVVTLLILAVTAWALWGLAARVSLSRSNERRVIAIIAALAVPYVMTIACGIAPFWLALAAYLPAVIALMIALIVDSCRRGIARHAVALLGLSLSLLAAAVQQRFIDVSLLGIGHNAAYHVLQIVAMLAMYQWARQEESHAQQA
jgi:hypothetical protein